MNKDKWMNNIFFKNSQNMQEIPDNSINLIVTSPPYFNIKDYSKNGYQNDIHSKKTKNQLGDIKEYQIFINELLKVWIECERVLVPNGKLIINVPLIPMVKNIFSTHHNRHIFDLNSDIQHSILYRENTKMYLYDLYIWNRTNTTKNLMFGSYPYPRNFYAQNTSEFICIYVKEGSPINNIEKDIKEASKLSQQEWVEITKQIWDIPIPNKKDIAFGEHSAIMPEEIVRRCVKLFTFIDDVVLDPFTGSGTTLKVAKELQRNYVGYEIMENYKTIIDRKINTIHGKLF